MDIVRFMKMLYMLVCPDGEFHPSRYDPSSFVKKKPAPNMLMSVKQAVTTARPKRFQNVQVRFPIAT